MVLGLTLKSLIHSIDGTNVGWLAAFIRFLVVYFRLIFVCKYLLSININGQMDKKQMEMDIFEKYGVFEVLS